LEEAATRIRAAARAAALTDVRPLILRGHLLLLQGAYGDAINAYQRGLSQRTCPLEVHLRLASAYMRTQQPQYAADVLTAAAGAGGPAARSPLLWLMAGRASLEAGDADVARVALMEANLLDPELPEPWGLLTLLAARQDRWQEAEQALSRGLALGLRDTWTAGGIAAEYERAGRWRQAADVLRVALAAADAASSRPDVNAAAVLFQLRCRLISALVLLSEAAEARRELDQAAVLAAAAGTGVVGEQGTLPEREAVAAQQLALLNVLALRVEALPVDEH